MVDAVVDVTSHLAAGAVIPASDFGLSTIHCATICGSEGANAHVPPKKENTRKDEETVSVKWAVLRLSDPNYFFVFSEEDREELLLLDEKILGLASRELKKDSLKATELVDELLPKKEVIRKKPTPKPKPKSKITKKTLSKSKKE